MERITTRLLARVPDQRYRDCAELIQDLLSLGATEEVPTFFTSRE
jgi:hypothetical protein